MSEHWDYYLANVDGTRSAICVDLSLLPTTPDSAKPILLRLTHTLRAHSPDGLSDKREQQTLEQIQARLTDVLGRLLSATIVGTVTGKSRQEYYFYIPETVDAQALEFAAQNAMQIFPVYPYETDLRRDAEWAFYRDFLFPRAISRQFAQNRRLLVELQESGDLLYAERPIHHWAVFKSDGDRKSFIDEIIRLGFTLADNGLSTSNYDDRPYCVEVQRMDAAQIEHIDEVTQLIVRLARTYNGKYDGWETVVVLRTSKKF